MAVKNKDLLKISQLAQKAGVSIPTVKHYVREGLLSRPVKTSRNMAYYRREEIDRIKLVKKIQKEKYLPLEVIKRLLDAGESFEEELALGEAILKTDRIHPPAKPIKRAGIEKAAGCPVDRIDLLEEKGLIHPLTEGGRKVYPPEDVELIRIMADRDNMGVPVESSLATLGIYGDAIAGAVRKDINFFIRNIMADTPTRQAIRFMTEADETLDRFIISFRHKMLRQFSRETIKALDRLSEDLAVLNFLPIPGANLPGQAPKSPFYNRLYHLLKGDGPITTGGQVLEDIADNDPRLKALDILSVLMSGNSAYAYRLVTVHIPEPTPHLLENTAAALAHLFSMDASAGFSVPMFNIKKVFHHLSRIENLGQDPWLDGLLARYTCGSIYIFLPDVFATRQAGIDLLETLKKELSGISFENIHLPGWLVRTLTEEIAPALRIRINRFLALGYVQGGNKQAARACLDLVIKGAGPESDHTAWAEKEKEKI